MEREEHYWDQYILVFLNRAISLSGAFRGARAYFRQGKKGKK
jgi:hypothetical protein